MISIKECNDNTENIEKEHTNFIVDSLTPIINFYLEIYIIKNQLTPHSRHNQIVKRIEEFEINGNKKNSLLSKLFINKKTVPDVYNSWKIKRDNLLLTEARNIVPILDSLNYLLINIKEIVSINLNEVYPLNIMLYEHYKVSLAPINFLLTTIFDYNWFTKLKLNEKWNAYKLTEALNIKVCPYCNRQRTFAVYKNDDKITRPELDHFLPKNENPILALNFHNLIPSCTVCNRDLKGDESFSYTEYLSPYEENIGHKLMKFDYDPLSYDGASGITEDIKITVKPSNGLSAEIKRKVEGNISIFKYQDISEQLTDVVQEIIYKRYISGDDYIQVLKKTFPNANLTDSEAYKIAYGNFFDEKDFSKRPLSKMTKDIAYYIGALKTFK